MLLTPIAVSRIASSVQEVVLLKHKPYLDSWPLLLDRQVLSPVRCCESPFSLYNNVVTKQEIRSVVPRFTCVLYSEGFVLKFNSASFCERGDFLLET